MNNTIWPSPMNFSGEASRVICRSFVLAADVCRGAIDKSAGDAEAEALYHRILDWLTQLDLWETVEPSEESILRRPLGELKQEEVIRTTWLVEGMAILNWSLNQFEFPRHDQKVDPYAVAEAIWFLNDDARELIETVRLRSSVELAACREFLYAIHARLRDFLRNGRLENFADWIEQTWLNVLGLDIASLIVSNDLAIDGKPISEVAYVRVQECEWLTGERHRAIIWLVELYASYSQTPVDT